MGRGESGASVGVGGGDFNSAVTFLEDGELVLDHNTGGVWEGGVAEGKKFPSGNLWGGAGQNL